MALPPAVALPECLLLPLYGSLLVNNTGTVDSLVLMRYAYGVWPAGPHLPLYPSGMHVGSGVLFIIISDIIDL